MEQTEFGSIFQTFSKSLQEYLLNNGKVNLINTKELLIKPDQYIRSFPLMLEGRIRISRINERGQEMLLYYLLPGEVCAMALTCCMGRRKSNIIAQSETDSKVLLIPVELLSEIMERFSEWKSFTMMAYQSRFDDLLNTIDSIAFQKMDERLVRFLKNYQTSTDSNIYDGTHQQIADALNSSREVITRLLKKMEQDGIVELSRNKIKLLKL